MKTVLTSSCCDGKSAQPIVKVRHISPALALSRQNAFREPLSSFSDKTNAIRYKCAMQRGGVKRDYSVKVGATGSSSRILQSIQGVGSAIAPGNFSNVRSPIRSRVYSALTPGGGNIPGGFGALKPERGYRCPEGYQYGGRFTDSRFSTCGKQLFDLPGIIGQTIARVLRGDPRSNFQRVSGRDVSALSVSGELIQSRAPQIPKVSTANRQRKNSELDKIVGAMKSVNDSYSRLVRRDGFVLEPVVTPAVLRTVPDNRDMEGATFVMNALVGEDIGNDELGLLSNTGVENVTYVLSGGSTISIRKARPLTVGERRKLGKTISSAEKTRRGEDPVERLRLVAAEMGDAIAYEENFENIKNPNEVITVNLPAGRGKKQMRRWMYEAFYRKKKKSNMVSRASQMEMIPEDEKIKDLASAVRHLNNGGSLENLAATVRSEAIKRSNLYATGKIKNGVVLHERADGQTVFEITPDKQYEHLGAALASDLQRWMGLAAPKVRLSGSGKKRNYMLGEAQDVIDFGTQERATDISAMPAEDIAGILISDFLTDTINRNPSTIAPIRIGGRMRAVSSLNANAGLAGMSAAEISQRRQMGMNDFFNRRQQDVYRQYFQQLKEAQRRKALVLFEQLMDRASDFDFRRFRQRLAVDGMLSESEKVHLEILEKLFERRVDALKSSANTMKAIIGLANRAQ
jgi:hypothetical protein